VGKTRTGKTTLARQLLEPYQQVIVHDAKGTIGPHPSDTSYWPGYYLCRGLGELDVARKYHSRLIYRPTFAESRSLVDQDAFFRFIFNRRNTIVYVDEVYLLCVQLGRAPDMYLACIQQGGERRVGVWSSTQRPTRIPLQIISEAEHCYVFNLRLWRDRKRMEEEWGIPREAQGALKGTHQFLYAGEGMEGYAGPTQIAV